MNLSAEITLGLPLAALATPGLLYAGLAAAAVPILIHLLNRRRFRRVRWAAVEFLLQADRENRRRIRIEEMILLALRCLAMGLVGLLLARWFLRPDALLAGLGVGGSVERIVVVDDSFSMGVRDGAANGANGEGPAGTLFDQARGVVGQFVRTWRDASPNDRLTVMLSSRPETPIEAGARIESLDSNKWEKTLDGLTVSNHAGNWPAVAAAVRQRLDGLTAGTSGVVYVVSDFQRVDWVGSGTSGVGRSRSPLATLADWADPTHSLQVVLVSVGKRGPDNLAVIGIESEQPQSVATIDSRFSVRITNFGEQPSASANLLAYVGDAALPATAVPAIEPGQTVEVALDVTFPVEGMRVLSVELPPDGLPPDNVRRTVVPVTRALRVLIVDGEKSANPYEDEVFLLSVALQPQGPQFSGNDVTTIEENDLEAADLSGYHVVVLANVYRITDAAADRLRSYVAGGGGLAIFLGDQVDPVVYNRLLYRDGQELLPGQLGEQVTCPADSDGWGLVDIQADHRLTRRLAEAATLLQPVRVRQFIRCRTDSVSETGPVAGRASSQPTSQAALPAHTLIRLGDEEKDPLLLERTYGQGHVMLFTSSADKEWNNLANYPAYVVLAMEAMQVLARSPAGGGEQLAGQPIREPVEGDRYQPSAWLKSPSFPEQPAMALEPQPDPTTGGVWLRWADTDELGIYRIERTDLAGKTVSLPVAVNVDPRESDLSRADEAALREATAGLDVDYLSGRDVAGLQDAKIRHELWPLLVVLVVFVLMVEQFLGWYFGCGRNLSLLWRGGKG